MSRSKDKGSAEERRARDVFREAGFPRCERAVLTGAQDRGDLLGVPDLTIEVKYRGKGQPLNLPEAVDESLVERENAGTRWAVATVHRQGKSTREAYAVMPLHEFAAMYHHYQEALAALDAVGLDEEELARFLATMQKLNRSTNR